MNTKPSRRRASCYPDSITFVNFQSKHFAISITYYDLLGKGHPQLITGWSNGKVDCRTIKAGEVLFKDTMNHGVAGLVDGDYRSVGKSDLICISVEGESTYSSPLGYIF